MCDIVNFEGKASKPMPQFFVHPASLRQTATTIRQCEGRRYGIGLEDADEPVAEGLY
jgi:hypothetical protein